MSVEELEYRGTGTLEAALRNAEALLASDPQAAAGQAREIVNVNPKSGDGWRLLGAALRRLDRGEEAEEAEGEAIRSSAYNPVLVEAALALRENRLKAAEHLLRPYLEKKPADAAAVRMLAEIAIRVGALKDGEELLRRALALAPAYTAAKSRLASLLVKQNRYDEALAVLDTLLRADGENVAAQGSKAALLTRVGEYREAIGLYEQLLARMPDKAQLWMSYGHLLKTVGRLEESVAAYRRAIGIDAAFGEAWWSLANLKTVRLTAEDVAVMEAALERPDLDPEARLHLAFALGKAHEDSAEFGPSFSRYEEANRIRRQMLRYDPGVIQDYVRRSKALFTADFLRSRAGQGSPAPDPIFVIGMPRAGSTLIEQILSSHSMIEGTSELPHIPALTYDLRDEAGETGAPPYPETLAELPAERLLRLGEDYLRSARLHRKTDRRFFTDKLPNNWLHIGFIQLILPNAKIVDARRHPLACCFSNFKQHFARGQAFSYSLEDLGLYYSDYVSMLDHFDTVTPGRIHRVIHERLIEDPEGEIRRLLDHLGLPFEEGCLRFWENERAVRTPSSEQVRRPINREGVEQWKAYDPWLGPLKEALGPVLECYPDAPEGGRG
jgi:tetratricopeptide (TPR) repeat protein